MKLNCQPGDLAVIVRSAAGNLGKIVRCVRLLPAPLEIDGITVEDPALGPVWEIDRALPSVRKRSGLPGRSWPYCADARLRPLRGDPEPESVDLEVGAIV